MNSLRYFSLWFGNLVRESYLCDQALFCFSRSKQSNVCGCFSACSEHKLTSWCRQFLPNIWKKVLTPELAIKKARTETLLHVVNDVTRFVNTPGLCTLISCVHACHSLCARKYSVKRKRNESVVLKFPVRSNTVLCTVKKPECMFKWEKVRVHVLALCASNPCPCVFISFSVWLFRFCVNGRLADVCIHCSLCLSFTDGGWNRAEFVAVWKGAMWRT